ncbi:hypothetical protein MP638_003615 [Amoeboaphelidium occidentale]|nr:hypothetical protein MP638_003615 [Amoeboaphelidium occidentale]
MDNTTAEKKQLKRIGRPLGLKITPSVDSNSRSPTVSPTSISSDRLLTAASQPKDGKHISVQTVEIPKSPATSHIRHSVTPSSAHPMSAGSDQAPKWGAGPYQDEPILILGNLYLGSEKNASSQIVLMKKNIGGIINVAKECKNHFEQNQVGVKLLTEELEDISVQDAGPSSPIYNPLNLSTSKNDKRMSSYSHAHSSYSTSHHDNNSSSKRISLLSLPSVTSEQKRQFTDKDVSKVQSDSASSIESDLEDETDEHDALELQEQTEVSEGANSSQKDNVSLLKSKSEGSLRSGVASSVDLTKFEPPLYLHLPWTHNEERILQYFKPAFDFIDLVNSKDKAVLIHCKQGLSRSATLVIAYVMKELKISMEEAYTFVKKKSPNVSPNLGFVFQLLDFEKEVLGVERKNISELDLKAL